MLRAARCQPRGRNIDTSGRVFESSAIAVTNITQKDQAKALAAAPVAAGTAMLDMWGGAM